MRLLRGGLQVSFLVQSLEFFLEHLLQMLRLERDMGPVVIGLGGDRRGGRGVRIRVNPLILNQALTVGRDRCP